MSRLIFLVISLFIVVRLYMLNGIESSLAGLAGVLYLASMVWFADFWANTMLRIGFWASKAADYKTSKNSAPAMVLFGWILLFLFVLLVALK